MMTWETWKVLVCLELTVWLVWLRFRTTHRLDRKE